jgi:hypothetical protein
MEGDGESQGRGRPRPAPASRGSRRVKEIVPVEVEKQPSGRGGRRRLEGSPLASQVAIAATHSTDTVTIFFPNSLVNHV